MFTFLYVQKALKMGAGISNRSWRPIANEITKRFPLKKWYHFSFLRKYVTPYLLGEGRGVWLFVTFKMSIVGSMLLAKTFHNVTQEISCRFVPFFVFLSFFISFVIHCKVFRVDLLTYLPEKEGMFSVWFVLPMISNISSVISKNHVKY